MGDTTYKYTDKYYYYYDATLTQTLLNQYVSTIDPANSSGTHFVYLNNQGTMSAFTGSRHTPNPEVYSGEAEEPTPSTQTSNYETFTAAVNVDFAAAWSAASAFGSQNRIPNGITLADDDTYAANITFARDGVTYAKGNNTRLTDITYSSGGSVWLGNVYGREEEVVLSSTGLGNVVTSTTVYYATTGQKLNGLRAKQDFGGLYLLTGASASATDVVVSRNMRELDIANADGGNLKNKTGNGTVVDSVTVSGRLNSVHVGSGASLNMLTVGLQRSFTSADLSAFGYFSSSYFGSGGSWVLSSATYMNIESGGTASNIYLNNGGQVTVFGPEDRVSSTWNSTTQQYDVTTSYASGAGGTLTNLQMSMSGGLQFGGLDDSETWNEANGVYWSADYRSHHRAAAPQSAYVEFQSNTSGSNVTIGNGGSMRIGKGASVVGISMGALTTSTFHTSGGKQMMWVGDRGAKLTIDGGFASNVAVEAAPLTKDYYFAVNNGFSTLSSSIQSAYYEQHSSYLDDKVASASAAAGYNAFMSSRYTSVSQELYDARYLGGEIIVNGGTLLNASRFAYLYAGDNPDWTFTSSGVSMTARIGEMVSKAEGALSATIEIDGAAHVTSITAAGGRFVMGANSGGVARWAGQSNAQSNYAQAEYINLRTSGLEGDNHSAMVLFGGYNGSGQQPVPVMSNGSQVHDSNGYNQWTYYDYECMDPGEIHYLTGDKGLIVKDLGWGGQNFTYTGSGAVTINGLGTVWTEVAGDRHYNSSGYYSSSSDGTSSWISNVSRWLDPSRNRYYFGVVKGVYDEENGKLQQATILNGDGGFDWRGTLLVGSGGIIQDIGSQAGLKTDNTLTSDSWNPVIENDASKILVVVAGGSADNVTVNGKVTNYEITSQSLYKNNAALVVSSGGTATDISVLSNGIAMVEGGTINGAYVGNGGILYLSGWAGAIQVSPDSGSTITGAQYLDAGVLNAVRLDSGGRLGAIYDYQFGGKAPSVIANKGGGILNGVTANGVAYVSGLDYAGAITLTKDQQAIDVTVRGFDTITSRDAEGKPLAYTTTIASLNVSSGGIVKGATVGEEGAIYVSQGADVSGLTASGGRLIFENEDPNDYWTYLPGSAAVAGITVKDGGILQVNSKFGLTATDMQIGESAGLDLYIVKDASDDFGKTELNGTWQTTWGGGTFHTNDGVLTGFGGQFGYEYRDIFYSSAYTSARLGMIFLSGGVLSGGDLRGYGYVTARNGGKIINTHIRGITANIGASGYASGLTATTESTGSAYDTNIYVYGSGAVADQTVLSGGFLAVENGATANGVTMMAPEGYSGPKGDAKKVGPAEMEITAGGRANNVVASAGVVTLYNGSYKDANTSAATLSNADIHSAATLVVNDDGVVLDGTLNLGGLVTTTAERYEYVPVEVTDPDTGDVYTDYQRITKNNAVANASSLTVNFDLTERDGTDDDAMIDNLANLQGAKLGTITVRADQANGIYMLAGGADAFNGTLSVVSGGNQIGDFSVGTYLQVNADQVYSLTNSAEEGLCFTIQSTGAAVTKILATVDGQPLKKGQWTNKAVTIKTLVTQSTKSIWYRIRNAALFQSAASGLDNGLAWASDAAPEDDGWTELNNETGVTVSEYCIVDFKAKDEAGQDSDVVSYTVNYDDVAPSVSGLRIVAGSPDLVADVNSVISVRVADNLDPAPQVEFSIGNDEWTAASSRGNGVYSFTVAGAFSLRATDHAGNIKLLPVSSISNGTAGDLNADGRADVIMSITEVGHGAEGATGAWLIQEDQTAAWGDLSQRNSGWEIFGTGKTAAGKNTDDVYIKNESNFIGAWTTGDDGKVTGWETVGEFDSETQIIGLGDFNGNGQTDLLLRNVNGAVGCFFTSEEKHGWNYFQSLGDEWKLSAVGDLNGDGRDDVVLKHDAGFAGSWLTQADGTMAWADLDTLQEGFSIVGTGDFNGDGTDDVLLQKGTYYGAWLVNNGNAAGWMGLGDLGGVTVEQIADFNGDGKDDLRIRTAAGDLGTQLVMGEDNLSWNYYGSVGSEWSTSLAALS